MDDEESIRTLGKRVLEKMGFLVTAVSDGADCVQSYREAYQSGRPFDFVILDLTVPSGMGGEEAMAELRRIDPGVRAIVSSGYSGDPVMSDYRKFGFCAVVPKPYDCKALAAVIDGLE
jgi:CheY-like chemotaxis protein